jgi:monothiol glutaredoxin
MDILQKIEEEVKNNDVVLYMKGSAKLPQCGFSARVASILERLEVSYKDVDILRDPELRQGIKDYTDWPTIPQLYVKGEFIGGCDIITEMFTSGELQQLLKDKNISCNI